MNQALDGVRIIDMTHALAGPSGTQLLADLGADVIKIENPNGGDFTRAGHPWVFQAFNRNKRSVTLDVKRPEGREVIRRLVASADVFVQSQRPGVVDRLGLGRDDLLQINPRLVYATFTGFGPVGPDSGRRAVDVVVQAESGLGALQGTVLGNVSVIDEAAGMSLAFAILAALHRRERTGEIDHVYVNLLDTAAYLQSVPLAEFSVTGTMHEQRDAARRFATVSVFEALDGPFFLAGDRERDWEAICDVIDRPDLVKEERFATAPRRLANVDEVHEILTAAFAVRARAELVTELEDRLVMAGTLRSYGDVLSSEQFRVNETFESLTTSTGQDVAVPRPPYRFAGRPLVGSHAAPVLGSATDEVLQDVGLSEEEIDGLRSTGVLGPSVGEGVAAVNLVFTDEQAAYRDAVRKFVDRVLRPLLATTYDFSTPLTRDDIRSLRAAVSGHEIATNAPRLDDGSVDAICFCVFIEEISRLNMGLASLAGALFFPVWDMVDLLDDTQRERFGHLFQPGTMISMGMSEPNVGSNPSQIETVARRADGGWIISGRKLWTSHAQIAAGVMVAARKLDDGDEQISLFMVDRDEHDYEVRIVPTLGMNATSTCEVLFDDCFVSADAELTPGEGGLSSALNLVEQARLKLVFMAVGVAQASLDLAVQYAKDRQQFGRPIGSFQLVQEMLAEMATEIEVSRLLGYRAASLHASGQPARAAMSMAKAYATEAAVRVTSMGIQVHGGIGLTTECEAERFYRDARMLTIPDGTTQIHQLVIGRSLTGLSAFV